MTNGILEFADQVGVTTELLLDRPECALRARQLAKLAGTRDGQ